MKRVAGTSVGVDYHTNSLRVTVMNSDGDTLVNRAIANDIVEFVRLVSRYGPVESVAVEASTGSAAFADAVKQLTGWRVKQCHPGYVHRMKANPDKSDKSDADLVCDLNRVGYLPEVWLAPAWIRHLRELVRYRQQLVAESTSLKLRVQAVRRNLRLKCPESSLWTKAGQAWLRGVLKDMPEHTAWVVKEHLEQLTEISKRIAASEARITKALVNDADMKKLLQEKGIGLVTAAILRAEIGDFHRFKSGKQLSRFCGYSPRNASSGERQADAGLIKAGNDNLRAVMLQAAHSLRLHNLRWRELSLKMQKEGKHPCVIVAAIANRFLRGLYYRMTRPEEELKAAA
jgi:transposase